MIRMIQQILHLLIRHNEAFHLFIVKFKANLTLIFLQHFKLSLFFLMK